MNSPKEFLKNFTVPLILSKLMFFRLILINYKRYNFQVTVNETDITLLNVDVENVITMVIAYASSFNTKYLKVFNS